MALSLMLEAGELAEHFQWKSDEEIGHHLVKEKDEIGAELADVLYWTLLMAHDFGIDLSQAFSDKMKSNAAKYSIEKCRGRSQKYDQL